MSKEEAIDIARHEEIFEPFRDAMTMARVEEHNGQIVWIVSSATVGSRICVAIDDATGKVVKAERLGVR